MVGRGVCGDDAGMLRAGLGHDRPGARWSVHPDNPLSYMSSGTSPRRGGPQEHPISRRSAAPAGAEEPLPPTPSTQAPEPTATVWPLAILEAVNAARRSVAIQQPPQPIPLRRRVGRMVSHIVPTAATGGGARPLGGLVHRAGAACRASGAGTIGGSSRRRTPCRCPTSTSQYGQHRRIQRCSGLRRAVSQIPGASRQTGGRARLASLGRCLPDFRATPERRPGVRWKLWMPKFVPTPANVWRAS